MKQFLILFTMCFMFSQTSAQITNGLVAYYPFTGNENDAIGTVHGTASNTTFVADRFGNANSACSFTSSGSRSSIDLGNNFNTLLAGSGAKFSISVWFKRASTSQKMTLFSKHSNSVYCTQSEEQLALLLNADGTLQINYYDNSGSVKVNYDITSGKVEDTDWHHLVVTYDGSIGIGQDRVNFYVDNTSWASTLTNNGGNVNFMPANTAHAGIGHVLTPTGAICSTSNYGSDGIIDDLGLYNRVLTLCDVDSIYGPDTLSIEYRTVTTQNNIDLETILSLYPNPVEDVLHIEVESKALENKNLSFQIINITGQVVKSEVLENKFTSVSTNQLAKGVYFVRILDKTKTITSQKIVKQ